MNSAETLLDTNVLSERMRPAPDANVSRYVSDLERPFVSAAVFHELSYGTDLEKVVVALGHDDAVVATALNGE